MDSSKNKLPVYSDYLFRSLIENSGEGIVLLDKNGRVIYISSTANKIFGYDKDKLDEIDTYSYIHPDDRHKVKQTFIKLLKTPNQKVNLQYRVKDYKGKFRWLDSTSSNLLNKPEIGAMVVNFRDITEKKEYEDKLELLEKITTRLSSPLTKNITINEIAQLLVPVFADFTRIVLSNNNGEVKELAIIHKDVSKVNTAKVLYDSYINNPKSTYGVKRILQTGNSEMISKIDHNLLKGFKTSKKITNILRLLKLKSYIGVPIKVNKKTVGVITVSSTTEGKMFSKKDLEYLQEIARRIAMYLTNINLYNALQTEISQRKKMESEIQQREKHFKALIENSTDAFRLTDKDGKIIYASPSTTKILGYSLKEYTTYKIFDLLHPDDRESYRKVFQTALRNPGKPIRTIYRIKHKNGEWRWMEGVGVNLLHDPNVNAVLSNFRDITDRRNLEIQKDEFMSIASHELKTPITSIKALAQVLKRRFDKKNDKETSIFLSKMNRQIDKLANLISDLLDVTKIELGKIKFNITEFYIDELISEIVQEMQLTTDAHTIHFKNVIHKKIKGDYERIGQVLVNLLSNAIKYSPDSSVINVSLHLEKKKLVIAIEDFGIGIPKKKQKELFQRFYRVNNYNQSKFPGLGLGLYITSEIIKRHNGVIKVKSIEGKGTTFLVYLPLK